jgi:hypothetical protein
MTIASERCVRPARREGAAVPPRARAARPHDGLAAATRPGAARPRGGVAAVVALAAALAAAPPPAPACDICAVYTATEMRESRTGFRLGVAEQFTRFATLKDDGQEVDNPGERVNSSITQILLGYDVTPSLGLQLNVPVITRDFRRRRDGVLAGGSESGFGDLALVAIARPFSLVGEESMVRLSLIGGLKFPTGDADRLREESEEGHGHGEAARAAHGHAGHDHGEDDHDDGDDDHGDGDGHEESGVHGHDLALGSGSIDGIVGGTVFASWKRLFLTTAVQYAIRTEGDFSYRYANDLTWSGGPGVFALLAHEYSLALQALVTGEYKAKDSLAGESVGDTAITAVYLGPGVTFTWGTTLFADIAADLPVSQDNTGLQIVPDYRIRGGITWRF